MEKTKLKGTYGYKNFISNPEKEYLVNWVDTNINSFKDNGEGRKYCILKNVLNSPLDLIKNIKNRIIQVENIKNWKPEPEYDDYIGINNIGASIHPHMDPNYGDYIHTRYNVILSYPLEGGESIYGNNINKLEENIVWKCIAGKVLHSSKPVIGFKPRITLSLGFLIKENNGNN